mmetsp:Transcript_82343/g.236603  ORF Transcript_82343/g.236603 Transcript_82343/m.236603 type:complete len:221 (+) Transcript_82343:612-1274(+)
MPCCSSAAASPSPPSSAMPRVPWAGPPCIWARPRPQPRRRGWLPAPGPSCSRGAARVPSGRTSVAPGPTPGPPARGRCPSGSFAGCAVSRPRMSAAVAAVPLEVFASSSSSRPSRLGRVWRCPKMRRCSRIGIGPLPPWRLLRRPMVLSPPTSAPGSGRIQKSWTRTWRSSRLLSPIPEASCTCVQPWPDRTALCPPRADSPCGGCRAGHSRWCRGLSTK